MTDTLCDGALDGERMHPKLARDGTQGETIGQHPAGFNGVDGVTRAAPKVLACGLGATHSGDHPVADQVALELGHGCQHVKEQPS